MNVQTLSNTDRTSWARVAIVWRFYLPFTRRKILSFATISILCELMIWLCVKYESLEGMNLMAKMLSTMLTVLVGCSALVFAKPKGRELQVMLPALGLEKCIVLIGYVAVIIPAIVMIPSIIMGLLLGTNHPEAIIANSILGSEVSPGGS